MTRRELLEKIRTFPILARGLSWDVVSGEFRSLFKGQGMEFSEVRPYEVGDDVRTIDWNVTARFNHPYVKLFQEEREMPLYLIVDFSASMGSPSRVRRIDQALLVGALLAFSAQRMGRRVGALFFSEEVTSYLEARKNFPAVMELILRALDIPCDGTESRLDKAFDFLGGSLKRKSFLVVISDFYCTAWEQSLGRLANRHDLLLIHLVDPNEKDFPSLGTVPLQDPESQRSMVVPTHLKGFNREWQSWQEERRIYVQQVARRYDVGYLAISTAEDPYKALRAFFNRRQ
ncbi:DUF58 domain-containing protein [Treponema sp. J25]|jgi:uncharacterized protein (DUF58 family)|uniref:DUF58 domain-containing protein n=1 Tax=Treponema sp. J25 TaxID=2094121 RepID=UPI0010535447|nr:DUF58 domain-containing protein [Treponema sp. J25]TCW60473.1 DUF58 domain-containing protein [Treponema sp. J25]